MIRRSSARRRAPDTVSTPPGLASPPCRATAASPAVHDAGRRARAEHHARAMPQPCQPPRTPPPATLQNVTLAPCGALPSAATPATAPPAAAPLLNRALIPIVGIQDPHSCLSLLLMTQTRGRRRTVAGAHRNFRRRTPRSHCSCILAYIYSKRNRQESPRSSGATNRPGIRGAILPRPALRA